MTVRITGDDFDVLKARAIPHYRDAPLHARPLGPGELRDQFPDAPDDAWILHGDRGPGNGDFWLLTDGEKRAQTLPPADGSDDTVTSIPWHLLVQVPCPFVLEHRWGGVQHGNGGDHIAIGPASDEGHLVPSRVVRDAYEALDVPSGSTPFIFFSYARDDRTDPDDGETFWSELTGLYRRVGDKKVSRVPIECFLDTEDIWAGRWSKQILSAIYRAQLFVVVIGPRWNSDERRYSRRVELPLAQLRSDGDSILILNAFDKQEDDRDPRDWKITDLATGGEWQLWQCQTLERILRPSTVNVSSQTVGDFLRGHRHSLADEVKQHLEKRMAEAPYAKAEVPAPWERGERTVAGEVRPAQLRGPTAPPASPAVPPRWTSGMPAESWGLRSAAGDAIGATIWVPQRAVGGQAVDGERPGLALADDGTVAVTEDGDGLRMRRITDGPSIVEVPLAGVRGIPLAAQRRGRSYTLLVADGSNILTCRADGGGATDRHRSSQAGASVRAAAIVGDDTIVVLEDGKMEGDGEVVGYITRLLTEVAGVDAAVVPDPSFPAGATAGGHDSRRRRVVVAAAGTGRSGAPVLVAAVVVDGRIDKTGAIRIEGAPVRVCVSRPVPGATTTLVAVQAERSDGVGLFGWPVDTVLTGDGTDGTA